MTGRLKIYEGAEWRYAGAGIQGDTGIQGETGIQGATGVAGATGVQGIKGTDAARYYADQFDSPNSADWAVNATAPASADASNTALVIRKFDDTVEEGVGFSLSVPTGMTNCVFTFKSRADDWPLATSTIVPTFYTREINNNAAVEAWTAGYNGTAISLPAGGSFYQYDTDTISLANLDMTAGSLSQVELTRTSAGAGADLTGDWCLLELGVSFT